MVSQAQARREAGFSTGCCKSQQDPCSQLPWLATLQSGTPGTDNNKLLPWRQEQWPLDTWRAKWSPPLGFNCSC